MSQLMEEILSRDNMKLAYKKVKANKGASGVDGITTDEVLEYLNENWASIKERIRKRKYKPMPVLRVEIPKAKRRSTKARDTKSGRQNHRTSNRAGDNSNCRTTFQ